jgi:hypothetical protein
MATKQRSPNYPSLNLAQALTLLGKLYTAEKRTPVSHEAAAPALGFRSLSGPARVAIAALRQYGFIDKAGKGAIRVSDLGVRVLHGNPEDKRLALAQAGTNPTLFKELAKEHADASENSIASYLITQKEFSPDGARRAAKAFRATLKLAKEKASGYNDPETEQEPEDMLGNDAGSGQDLAGKGGTPQPGVFSMSVPFSKGSISVQVRVTGDSLKPAHLARVRKYLEMAEQDWDTETEQDGAARRDVETNDASRPRRGMALTGNIPQK